jgi:hypothetical protein
MQNKVLSLAEVGAVAVGEDDLLKESLTKRLQTRVTLL